MLLAASAACTSVPDAPANPGYALVGCWQGQDYQPLLGQKATWLMRREEGGAFEIEFRASGQTVQREAGRWRVDGETYTTLTMFVDDEPVDVLDPQFTDVYLLRDVTPTSMTYFHSGMNVTFQSNKVACPDDV